MKTSGIINSKKYISLEQSFTAAVCKRMKFKNVMPFSLQESSGNYSLLVNTKICEQTNL